MQVLPKHIKDKTEQALFIKNFIFGVEDSLVSTSGLISGIAAAQSSKSVIFLTGTILIFVEAFSMGVGSYLSEEFAEDYTKLNRPKLHLSLISGLIMFLSYFISGFLPLVPYLFFEIKTALFISITVSLLALFLLGAISAKFWHVSILKHGLKMLIIGGLAILIGIVIGNIFHA